MHMGVQGIDKRNYKYNNNFKKYNMILVVKELWCQISHSSELLALLSVLLLNAKMDWNANLYTFSWRTLITLAESAGVPLGYINTSPPLNSISYPLSSKGETNMRFFLIPGT